MCADQHEELSSEGVLSFSKYRRVMGVSREGVVSIIMLFTVIVIVVATAVRGGGDVVGPVCSSRELWRVLFGGAASLFSLLMCLVHWNPCHLIWQNDVEDGAAAGGADDAASTSSVPQLVHGTVHQFVMVLLKTLSPHLSMACTVTIVYAALTMRQRCKSGRIAKRICPLVIWIGIDEATYIAHLPAINRVFRDRYLKKVPNLKIAVPWPGSSSTHLQLADYYLCSHDWEPRNKMWKEAMIATKVLGEKIDASMEMIERGRPWWAAVLLVMQAVGYQVSFASRLAQGLEVSPVEVLSVWMSLFVVVEAGIMPLFVIPSKRGICLRLDHSQFHRVTQYYHTHEKEDLNLYNLWCFVLCILFIFFMFLVLIPPLVYYYRQLPRSALSFASLIPFTLLAGAGIVAFAFTMFLPPQDALFAFTKHTSKYIFAMTLAFLLTGLASYVLATAETSMHWTRFQAADPSSFRFIIPHIGA